MGVPVTWISITIHNARINGQQILPHRCSHWSAHTPLPIRASARTAHAPTHLKTGKKYKSSLSWIEKNGIYKLMMKKKYFYRMCSFVSSASRTWPGCDHYLWRGRPFSIPRLAPVKCIQKQMYIFNASKLCAPLKKCLTLGY